MRIMASVKPAPRIIIALLAILAGAAAVASAQTTKSNNATLDDTRDTNLRAYVELLRSDLRTQKVAITAMMMALGEAEDEKFWPIYRDYETQLAKLNDERIKGIEEYADNFAKVTDELADRLIRAALSLEDR